MSTTNASIVIHTHTRAIGNVSFWISHRYDIYFVVIVSGHTQYIRPQPNEPHDEARIDVHSQAEQYSQSQIINKQKKILLHYFGDNHNHNNVNDARCSCSSSNINNNKSQTNVLYILLAYNALHVCMYSPARIVPKHSSHGVYPHNTPR